MHEGDYDRIQQKCWNKQVQSSTDSSGSDVGLLRSYISKHWNRILKPKCELKFGQGEQRIFVSKHLPTSKEMKIQKKRKTRTRTCKFERGVESIVERLRVTPMGRNRHKTRKNAGYLDLLINGVIYVEDKEYFYDSLNHIAQQ